MKEKRNKETFVLWEDEIDKEIVLKYIYDYCVEYEYDDEMMAVLAEKLDSNIGKINQYAESMQLTI